MNRKKEAIEKREANLKGGRESKKERYGKKCEEKEKNSCKEIKEEKERKERREANKKEKKKDWKIQKWRYRQI